MVNKEYFLLIFSSCKGWHNRCIVGVKHLLNIAMGKASKKKRLKTSTPPQEISDNNISTGILSKPFLHIFFIITLGILIYSNTFKAPFVFDDISMYIVENPAIKDFKYFLDASRLDETSVDKGFREQFKNRIVAHLTLAINYKLHGLNVIGYHIFNLAVHIINALLVYYLVSLTFKAHFFKDRRPAAFSDAQYRGMFALFCSLLFVSHPLQTQAVTYISQRLASLAALFYLFSLVLYIKSRLSESGGRRYGYYLLSILAAVSAVKTKEISFTLPLVITIYELMFLESSTKKKLFYLIPFYLVIVLIPLSLIRTDSYSFESIISSMGQKSKDPDAIPRLAYLFTQFRVIVTYIRLFFIPVDQNLDYDFPVYSSFLTPEVFLSFLFLFLIFTSGACLFYCSRYTYNAKRYGYRLISFGIFYFFITLSTESSIIPLRDVIFEHRVYLPSAGLIIAVAASVFVITGSDKNKTTEKAMTAVLLLIILAFSVAAYARNSVWKEQIALWGDTAKKSPLKARPHYNLGVAYAEKKQFEDAVKEYLMAIQIDPNYYLAHNNLGFIYDKQSKLEDAVKHYAIAIKIKPDFAEAHNGFGLAYEKQSRFEEAVKEFSEAIGIKPDYHEAHYNLGNVYAKQGRTGEAVKEYLEAVRIKPDYTKAYNNLGVVYSKDGRFDEAIEAFRNASRFQPDDFSLHYNLGKLYIMSSRFDEAITEYLAGIKLKPDFAELYNDLGVSYLKKGQAEKASDAFKTALKLNPDFAEAVRNLEGINR